MFWNQCKFQALKSIIKRWSFPQAKLFCQVLSQKFARWHGMSFQTLWLYSTFFQQQRPTNPIIFKVQGYAMHRQLLSEPWGLLVTEWRCLGVYRKLDDVVTRGAWSCCRQCGATSSNTVLHLLCWRCKLRRSICLTQHRLMRGIQWRHWCSTRHAFLPFHSIDAL